MFTTHIQFPFINEPALLRIEIFTMSDGEFLKSILPIQGFSS